jgi:hypothetical protein
MCPHAGHLKSGLEMRRVERMRPSMSSSSSQSPNRASRDRSSRQRRCRCSTISGNQTRCASPAATAHHLRLLPSRRVGVPRSSLPVGPTSDGNRAGRARVVRRTPRTNDWVGTSRAHRVTLTAASHALGRWRFCSLRRCLQGAAADRRLVAAVGSLTEKGSETDGQRTAVIGFAVGMAARAMSIGVRVKPNVCSVSVESSRNGRVHW